ncbi:MAG TPA: pantoate--beta-alanine ligase [Jatrophihabitans sp.]|nr:pantoate--beta-alanine ligase [Jatrophihabitans sp.]
MTTQVVRTRAELAAARAQLPGPVGLVPTMGALHAGHLANIEASRQHTAATVVSIFVNPMQFDRADDLARYPRTFEQDLALCEQAGVALVWHPDVLTMYPNGPVQVRVSAGELADQLEGPHRPGHFDGVLTVVLKLLLTVRPDHAFFGEKDYQQLTLIRRMVADLDLPVQVHGVPTVRDSDGLALSSRNVFLSPAERAQALRLNRALRAAQSETSTPAAALARARAELAGLAVEYLEVRSAALTAPTPGPGRVLVAAQVGNVRLIDNMPLNIGPAS